MEVSFIFGCILIVLGIICIVVGIVISALFSLLKIAEKQKKFLISTIEEKELKIIEIVVSLFKEMLKHQGGIFFVVGLFLIGIGVYLIKF